MRNLSKLVAGAVSAAAIAFGAAIVSAPVSAGGHEEHAEVGQKAPDFTLVDVNGKEHTLSDYTNDGKIVVLEWFNSGCPFVVRHYDKYTTMADTSAKYAGKDVQWIAINSGAPGKQGHGKDKEAIEAWNIEYPILIDESGKVGHMYGAKTTPHMYIIHKDGTLVYAGGIDNDPRDSMPYESKINYVAKALDEIIAGTPVSEAETRPYGCSVKYAK